MREIRARCYAPIALLAFLVACSDQAAETPGSGPAQTTVQALDVLPAPPEREAFEFKWLPGDVFESVCRLGHPVAVLGWDLDPETRFVYFAGPFVEDKNAEDSLVSEYIYKAIQGPERRSVSTSLMLNADSVDLTRQKPDELQRYTIPRLTAVGSNISENIALLGEPTVVHERKSASQQRYVFARKFCLGEQLLEGIYLDVDDGQVVKAKGVEHPERLKWLLSRNRPPEPDAKATYYLDVSPLEGSPQAAAVAFIETRERGDEVRTRRRVWEEQSLPDRIDALVKPTRPGARIDHAELRYQTTRYSLDEVEVVVRYAMYTNLDDARPAEAKLVLRKHEGDWWVVR